MKIDITNLSYHKNDPVEVDIDATIIVVDLFGYHQNLVTFCVCFTRIAMLD